MKLRRWYRFRWFHSKGALLILTWSFMTTAALYMIPLFYKTPYEGYEWKPWVEGLCSLTGALSAPFFGWLADAKLGNYKVIKIGFISAFVASVLNSLYFLLDSIPLTEPSSMVMKVIVLIFVIILYLVGAMIAVVNLLQMGLEQLPDGSADNLTSLISWMVFVFFAGKWTKDVIRKLAVSCKHSYTVYQVLTLLPVALLTVVLSSYYILSPKWLIIEPNSPQSLKNIFRVLKFAAKHKAPLNRSALTYWEEDIPSRLDLGKLRFGGPFTTDQVEDVKTFFRLLAVSVPIFLMIFASVLCPYNGYSPIYIDIPGASECVSTAVSLFTFDYWWCAMLTVVLNEFVIFPWFNYRLPCTMKRLGFTAFATVLQILVYLVLSVLEYFGRFDSKSQWFVILNSMVFGVLIATVSLSSLEFVCAQSPYSMRGLLMGYMVLIGWLAYTLATTLREKFVKYCTGPYCSVIYASIVAALGIFAFVLYLIIARWYKRRVRDDEYPAQAVVEEVYDRYLTAQSEQLPYRVSN